MDIKTYTLVSGIVFSMVAILQGLRVVKRTTVVVGSWTVPLWASGVATLVAAFLAVSAFRLY